MLSVYGNLIFSIGSTEVRDFKGYFGDKDDSITAKDFGKCADGWIRIDKKCYGVFNDSLLVVCLLFHFFSYFLGVNRVNKNQHILNFYISTALYLKNIPSFINI